VHGLHEAWADAPSRAAPGNVRLTAVVRNVRFHTRYLHSLRRALLSASSLVTVAPSRGSLALATEATRTGGVADAFDPAELHEDWILHPFSG
jgi:hypothetical protein